MSLRLALWAALAGGLIPIMAVLNARLGRALGDALYAPMALFIVALTTSVIAGLNLRSEAIDWSALIETQPINFAGGLIVCFYVLSATLLAPRIGVGNFIMFAVVSQVFVAALIDHFGLFGAVVRELNTMRLVGLAFLVLGLIVSQFASRN